jgi:hypothetical protein
VMGIRGRRPGPGNAMASAILEMARLLGKWIHRSKGEGGKFDISEVKRSEYFFC